MLQESTPESSQEISFKEAVLNYHEFPQPGKLSVNISKPTDSQKDLTLAYTPGVAIPVREIAADPNMAYRYTAKGNLVGVITNGTAVLGLGNVGPLASKPVMEGKAVLFKKFANIDVFDIEIDEKNPANFIETVVRIAPTFGGINLEDIKGPECFEIEEALIERLEIPVFHDDQHGTAIIIVAGLLNALELQNKKLEEIKVVCLGAGAAGIASMKLLMEFGLTNEQLYLVDTKGIVYEGRPDLILNPYKQLFAVHTDKRTLSDAMVGADVFIGVSGANLLAPEQLASMAPNPIIFALSNPDPEIMPHLANQVRQDLIMATGRSDFPNQVNNLLCFPYLFRGALDVRARHINQAMKIAAVNGIRQLAKEPVPQEVLNAYNIKGSLEYGKDYILPKPTDPRLIHIIPPMVARAAIETGMALQGYPAHYPVEFAPKK